MKKFTILAGLGTLAIAGVALAQAGTTPAAPDRTADVTRQQLIAKADDRFARLDVNRDGRATPDEARQAGEQRRTEMAGQMFDRMDANHDGNVTRAEFDQARTQMHEGRGEGRGGGRGGWHGRGRGGHGGHGMRGEHGERMFGEQGFITQEQMRERALARFDRMDANHDGTLTAAERQQSREALRQQFRERREQSN
jgi:Ca2+-binding EF-hand superfamily protein